ncbi:MAG: transglutaminase family protein [Alphaproteobacteria bacterium]|nr:transglutaminase family protein [Alphaproteobacteria bacterium]
MEHTKNGFPTVGPEYLKPTEFLDFDTPAVRAFALEAAAGAATDVDKAVKLYYAVRDRIRYDPYRINLERALYKASNLLAAGAGFCLPKAVLLAASARANGIPAGIGLADVVNHLCTERLRVIMGGKELFLHHGFAVLYLGGRWLKAAPAFNIELCDRFDVLPTEFDGTDHALFQEFDKQGRKHMQYMADHGMWSDFPFDRVVKDFRDYYPSTFYDEGEKARVLAGFSAPKRFEEERPLT